MALLSRKEQAYVIRVISSLSTIKPLAEVFTALEQQYKDVGAIDPKWLGIRNFRQIRNMPLALRKYIKGYIAYEFRKLANEIIRGKNELAIKNSPLFDQDIKETLISSLKTNSLTEVAYSLADFIEKEIDFLTEFNNSLITFYLVLIFIWGFIWIMAYKTIPAFLKVLGSVNNLPPVPRFIYTTFNEKPYFFYIGIIATLYLVYLMWTTRTWKLKVFPVFREFEKQKFLTLAYIFHPLVNNLEDLLTFLEKAGLSDKWRKAFKEIKILLAKGRSAIEAFKILLRHKLLSHSEMLFLSTAIEKSDFSILKEATTLLEANIKSQLQATKKAVEVITLLVGATIIGGLYALVFLQLVVKLKNLS